ncbi:death domain-associated protein [Halobacteriales archaeon QS_1_67_19]|nr:MAG: death domain-associated protein [Halobacteriales archaeon QS_1_67_19]
MGFGSYDEAEQDNQEYDADLDDSGVSTHENDHDGSVDFEIGASNDELIDRLKDIKDDGPNEA